MEYICVDMFYYVLFSASRRVVPGCVYGECIALRTMVIFCLLTSVIGASCLTTLRNALLQNAQNRLGHRERGARCDPFNSLHNEAGHIVEYHMRNTQLCKYRRFPITSAEELM